MHIILDIYYNFGLNRKWVEFKDYKLVKLFNIYYRSVFFISIRSCFLGNKNKKAEKI